MAYDVVNMGDGKGDGIMLESIFLDGLSLRFYMGDGEGQGMTVESMSLDGLS